MNNHSENGGSTTASKSAVPRWLLPAGGAVIILAGIGYLMKSGSHQATPETTAMPPPASASATTAVIPPPAIKQPRLVDLGATTCIPCKEMEPILESLRTGYAGKLTVDFINVRTEAEKAKPYRIQLIPTQIWFDADGKELYRHEGVIQAVDIVAKFKEHGIDLGAPTTETIATEANGKTAVPKGTVCP